MHNTLNELRRKAIMLRTRSQNSEINQLVNDELEFDVDLLFRTTERKAKKPNCNPSKFLKNGIYFVSLINALNDASQTTLGLFHKPDHIRYPITALSFLSSLAMSSRYLGPGIDSAIEIIKNRRVPDDWPAVASDRKRKFALGTAIVMAGYVMISDGIQSYSFASRVPSEYGFEDDISPAGWKALSTVIALCVGITVILTEGIEGYKALREIVSENKVTYFNDLSKKIGLTLVCTFGTIGVVNDAITSFYGMDGEIDITTPATLVAIGSCSLIFNGFSYYAINGRNLRDSTDEVIADISNNGINHKKILSVIISLAAAGLLGYASQGLTEEMDNDIAEKFGFYSLNFAIASYVFSWVAAGDLTINNTTYLFDMLHNAIDAMNSALGKIYKDMTKIPAPEIVKNLELLEVLDLTDTRKTPARRFKKILHTPDETLPLLEDDAFSKEQAETSTELCPVSNHHSALFSANRAGSTNELPNLSQIEEGASAPRPARTGYCTIL